MYSAVQYYTVTRRITLLNESENFYLLKSICFNLSPDLPTQFRFPFTDTTTYEIIKVYTMIGCISNIRIMCVRASNFKWNPNLGKVGGVHVQSIKSKLKMNYMTSMRESQMKTLNITIKFNGNI